jgi:hypothetical protein
MNIHLTVVEGVVLSPDSNPSAVTTALNRAAGTGYQGQSISDHPVLHLWHDPELAHTANANGTQYNFGIFAMVSGQLELDHNTDNAISLPEIDVTLADGIIFHPMSVFARVIMPPLKNEAVA